MKAFAPLLGCFLAAFSFASADARSAAVAPSASPRVASLRHDIPVDPRFGGYRHWRGHGYGYGRGFGDIGYLGNFVLGAPYLEYPGYDGSPPLQGDIGFLGGRADGAWPELPPPFFPPGPPPLALASPTSSARTAMAAPEPRIIFIGRQTPERGKRPQIIYGTR